MIVLNKSVNLYLGDQNHWFIVQLQISYNRQHSFFDTNGFSWSCIENKRCSDSSINVTHCNATKHRIIILNSIFGVCPFMPCPYFFPGCSCFVRGSPNFISCCPSLALDVPVLSLAVPVWAERLETRATLGRTQILQIMADGDFFLNKLV